MQPDTLHWVENEKTPAEAWPTPGRAMDLQLESNQTVQPAVHDNTKLQLRCAQLHQERVGNDNSNRVS
jgi:hypothetical protein